MEARENSSKWGMWWASLRTTRNECSLAVNACFYQDTSEKYKQQFSAQAQQKKLSKHLFFFLTKKGIHHINLDSYIKIIAMFSRKCKKYNLLVISILDNFKKTRFFSKPGAALTPYAYASMHGCNKNLRDRLHIGPTKRKATLSIYLLTDHVREPTHIWIKDNNYYTRGCAADRYIRKGGN
ncbi:hypothetical protein ACJX0J_032882 [Zea mays]